MKPSDFEQATEDERDLLAVRYSRQVRTDDHAFTAVMARICGHGGPKPISTDTFLRNTRREFCQAVIGDGKDAS